MPRKIEQRNLFETFLILVEGHTERIYFEEMRDYDQRQGITIMPKKAKHSDQYHIIKEALVLQTNVQTKILYDHIWCVYDCDTLLGNLPHDFEKLYQQGKENAIEFAESMPCFEIWFLLHYTTPKSYYQNQDEVINDLRVYINDYSKEQSWLYTKNLYSELKKKQENAVIKASSLPAPKHGVNDTGTSVSTLIKQLLK
jgi:hypothetical protein